MMPQMRALRCFETRLHTRLLTWTMLSQSLQAPVLQAPVLQALVLQAPVLQVGLRKSGLRPLYPCLLCSSYNLLKPL